MLNAGDVNLIALAYLAHAHRHLMDTTKEFDINVVEAEQFIENAFLSIICSLKMWDFRMHADHDFEL